MANYYKAKILHVGHDNVRDEEGKKTDELQPVIELEVLMTRRLKIEGAQHMQAVPLYEQNIGKVVMISADEGVFNGMAWMKMRGDGVPLLVSIPELMPVSKSDSSLSAVPPKPAGSSFLDRVKG